MRRKIGVNDDERWTRASLRQLGWYRRFPVPFMGWNPAIFLQIDERKSVGKMANCVLIDKVDENRNSAWHKVKKDATTVCSELGFQSVIWHDQAHGAFARIPDALRGIHELRRLVGNGEWILLQYPHHPLIVQMTMKAIEKLKKKKGCKLLILIHDLCYLRGVNYAMSRIRDMREFEVDVLNHADAIIVHNDSMKDALKNAGVTKKMVCLNFFDYCCDEIRPRIFEDNQVTEVAYAGDLSKGKSDFIYQCPQLKSTIVNLYGSQVDGELQPCFKYQGSVNPNKLVNAIEGHYGLVWNGVSADTCSGNFGEYLKYNSPHKLSLYLASGMPVVVWKESAMAKLVSEKGIGIAISSLDELDDLPGADSPEYKNMVQNLAPIRTDICSGNMLKKAITNIVSEV